MKLDKFYWDNRYTENSLGWDIGYVSTPLKEYFDQLKDKSISILIPGAGNSYEAEYLHNQGFQNVFVVDISQRPLNNLKKRCPEFPEKNLLLVDFFDLETTFDLIIEQTFFCAINPSLRKKYFEKVYQLLKSNGKIVGLLFNDPLFTDHPPFGGSKEEYLTYFSELFEIFHYDISYNSIPPRAERELFFCLKKK